MDAIATSVNATPVTTADSSVSVTRGPVLGLMADLWSPMTDESTHVPVGDVCVLTDDIAPEMAGGALDSAITGGFLEDADAWFIRCRAAWREIDETKRVGARDKANRPLFPGGADVKRVLASILGYVDGVAAEMPATGKGAPATIGAIRSVIRPLVPAVAETSDYAETVKMLANNEGTAVRVQFEDRVRSLYRPGPLLAGPWIDVKAFSAALGVFTFNRKAPKIGGGRMALAPSGNGWTVKRFLSMQEAAEIVAKLGVVKATLWESTAGMDVRPAIIVPAVSGEHYNVKRAALDAFVGQLVVSAQTLAVGGKLSKDRALMGVVQQGAAARATMTAEGCGVLAQTADAVGATYGSAARFTDW